MSSPVTGRFAPTPSGRLHLGNLLCCLLAYLSARSQGGRFLLRIEDLDVPRCPKRLCDQCIEDLRFLGFDWDEEPLYQSERTEIYQKYFDALKALGLVYPCFCTRAQLHAAIAKAYTAEPAHPLRPMKSQSAKRRAGLPCACASRMKSFRLQTVTSAR